MNEVTIKHDKVVITISEDECDVWEAAAACRAALLGLGFNPASVDEAIPA